MKINLKRIFAALRYLFWASPPYKWKLSMAECPSCGKSIFLHLRSDAFMTRCLRCKNNVTNLAIISVIKNLNIAEEESTWEMSTYGATHDFIKKTFYNFKSSEYVDSIESGKLINGILVQDATKTSFPSNSIFLITSNQVFEHIPNDLLAYKECFRILKKNGYLIFSIPLYDIPHTKQIAEIVNGKLVFNGVPEYHSSRTGGYRSAPTFWHHSINDIQQRVSNFGFEVNILNISISEAQKKPAIVICCKKLF
jgi:hypothetical protein